jgi:hypothetical protein
VAAAEEELKTAKAEVEKAKNEAARLTDVAKSAATEEKPQADKAVAAAAEQLKQSEAAVSAAEAKLKAATATATPKDIVDIVVSRPVRIRVHPAEAK